jgi:outer membrane receptor for ferrienterochelin and colicins
MRILCGMRSIALASWALAFLVPAASGQQAVLTGSTSAEGTGVPLASVLVEVLDLDGAPVARTLTGPPGTFRLEGMSAGTYTVRFRLSGWAPAVRENVRVEAGQTVHVEAVLEPRPFTLNPVTVTVGRNEEKLLDAPASISAVDRRILEEPALGPADHIAEYAGVDVMKVGLTQAYVAVRGFNSVLSGRLLTLVDHRMAQLPALRSNLLHGLPTTGLEMERIEIVRGAGAALYGPNAADGVLHILTRSPLDHPGGEAAVGFGVRQQRAGDGFEASNRPLLQSEARVGHRLTPELGVKVSAGYMTGTDYRYLDPDEEQARGLADMCLADPGLPPCQTFPPDLDPGDLERVGRRDFNADTTIELPFGGLTQDAGLIGFSDDGSRAYGVSRQQLDGAPAAGPHAHPQ